MSDHLFLKVAWSSLKCNGRDRLGSVKNVVYHHSVWIGARERRAVKGLLSGQGPVCRALLVFGTSLPRSCGFSAAGPVG